MPLAAQIAKLLTKGAQDLMSSPTGAIMKHSPTMRVLTPEQEAASFAPVRTSSYDTPETPVDVDVPEPTVKLKKGKTREEVEIQGGPLSSTLNEQKIGRLLDDHSIEWEYNDNGGITATEEFSKGPSRKKYFKSNTSLRTIRNWLGYSKGGVVDMRNGGRVGAAVVAASLMASGGQAMDMRNGGVVGMVHGGPVHGGPVLDYTTPEEKEFDKDYDAVKQIEALLAKRQAAVDYGGFEQPAPMPDAIPSVPEEKPRTHIHGTAKELVMKHLRRLKIQDTEQALNNLDSWTEKVMQSESDGNRKAKERSGKTTASGAYQFVKGSVGPALNRLEKYMGKMPWGDELLKHKDASKLTAKQQTLLFLGDILEKQIDKTSGVGDVLLARIFSGDKQGMLEAYYKMHLTNTKGLTPENIKRIQGIFGLKVSSNPTVN